MVGRDTMPGAEVSDVDGDTDRGAGAPAAPARRRVRRRTGLSRADVLGAALALVDADGVEALSMRRLGAALSRDPMRLYRYASSKEDLLDGIVEFAMAELPVPATPADGDWEEALRRAAHAFRELALAHPHLVPLMATRPLATPLATRPLGMLRPLEALLDLLIRAGFDGGGALHAYRLYAGFLYGHVLNELQERAHGPDEGDDLLRLGLHRLPVPEFPRLRALAGELAAYDGERELDEGLDVILTGLRPRTTVSPENASSSIGVLNASEFAQESGRIGGREPPAGVS
ncbi:TetR family transcriptional regulator [Pseudonocardia hierapolitana]|uniref:TetR family transcriptional regulator n=1 Tax=Pseudonocardia hierapolitana TaxID=1128676 RepID=A0A561T0P7_9PSEU|nr:TetR/AcrR family transcriptional regulator C-terminal domain-containing protein [Pseudonocardia hierapolitana]TWF80673.1 TetR family transcriptional regulator [Pseudonocardia hierapolitana]